MVRIRSRLVGVAIVMAVVLLAAAAGTLVYTETASVKLSVTPRNFETVVTLAGGPTGGSLATQRFRADVTESRQGSASTVQVDGRSAQVIQQSDYDAVLNPLTAKVNDELGAALYANAQGRLYVGDSRSFVTVTSDHKVGDETPSFTITMSAAIAATAFSETEANAILLAALRATVPAGMELTDDPVQNIFQGRQVGLGAGMLDTGNDVLVTGKADGYVIPTLSARSLAPQLAGLSQAAAASWLQRTAPGSRAEIRTSPSAMPWMPIIADHITLSIVLVPPRGHF